MSLSDLQLKTGYRKGLDNIAAEFYMPCMAQAALYDRAVGFFNSAIYVISWPTLREFVARGSKMRLVCSPVLAPNDVEAVSEGYSARMEGTNAARLREQIQSMLASPYLYKPTKVLASLVALGVIEFRVAFMERVPGHERIFHEKLGLFHDGAGNTVVFKGSMNESWAGLSADGNLESVDVFVSWEHARESQRVGQERTYFEELWKSEFNGVTVRPFPEIAREELINAADIKNWPDLVDDICREMEVAKRFTDLSGSAKRTLRPHQSYALQEWEKRGRRGIFEHATGSGKTFTALCAIREAFKNQEIALILVPSELLLEQWREEISTTLADQQPQLLLCGGGHSRWRNESLLGPWSRTGARSRIILATMQTAASEEFRAMIRQGKHLFMVADEVHRLGSVEHLKLLDLETGPRLGLSATPRRAGDPSGTRAIFEYFHDVVPPPFTLKDAIESNALTPYLYYVHPVELSPDEQDAWHELTQRIKQFAARSAKKPLETHNEHLKRLLIERARILKGARLKIALSLAVIRQYYERGQRWIVYCDNLDQLQQILVELRSGGIDASEYHSTMSGDRAQTLRLFGHHGGILVSIRCLDEGVDIPSVSHALILASSRNPREFIQRRGRVLRKAEGKSVAFIHDAVVVPLAISDEDPSIDLLAGEMTRAIEFGRNALNPSSITDLERIALRFGLDYDELAGSGYEED
jgi:superfamily II DNA or RNA helicase